MVNIGKNVLRQALDLAPSASIIVDVKSPSQPVVYVNHAFEAVSGYSGDELIGRAWATLCEDHDFSGAQPSRSATLQCHPSLGEVGSLKVDLVPLYERPGTPRYWMGSEQTFETAEEDAEESEREALMSVLREARRRLSRLDGHDTATGLLNRHAFEDLLRRDWVIARREKRGLSLVLFRLDDFDAYRDVYGRHASDECLRKVAHVISGGMRRAGDLTTRFAEDQFAVLLSSEDKAALLAHAADVAKRVRGLAIHHPRSLRDRFVTVSFGAATMQPSATNSVGQLLRKAEEAFESDASAPQAESLTLG